MTLIDTKEIQALDQLFFRMIARNLNKEALLWLESKINLIKSEENSSQLSLTFAQISRFAAKEVLELQAEESAQINALLPGYALKDWSIERLCRVWILMQIPYQNKDNYIEKLKYLFATAEMNELVALYSALPVFYDAEEWISKCEEGIRSNIGTILEAIMYHNPYPAHYLSEAAWNQMVLKAFFTEKDSNNVVGLQERANLALSDTLNDYIQERLAAHRSVNTEIYKLVNKNINS
ncbi:hypothetical protein AAKU52_001104 [Pedobacter sp. CG_S7]|uniref:EboA domain-containing protein n=1 Tax=Pedobacter sp. CG_S7 TaxID=3143930 RepID=UPI003391D878